MLEVMCGNDMRMMGAAGGMGVVGWCGVVCCGGAVVVVEG